MVSLTVDKSLSLVDRIRNKPQGMGWGDWAKQNLNPNELQRYEMEQEGQAKKREAEWRAEDILRDQDQAREDAKWIRTYGAVPGTSQWFAMTDKANAMEQAQRNVQNIQARIAELEKPSGYKTPTGKEVVPGTGIYKTPEGGYSNIDTVAGPRGIDTLKGQSEYNRLIGKQRLLDYKGKKTPTEIEEEARARAEGTRIGQAKPEITKKDQLAAARAFYKAKADSMKTDMFGGIKEDLKADFENIPNELAMDLKLINEGKNPKYLGGEEKQVIRQKIEKRQIIRTGKDPQGRKVVQYSDGAIEYATD